MNRTRRPAPASAFGSFPPADAEQFGQERRRPFGSLEKRATLEPGEEPAGPEAVPLPSIAPAGPAPRRGLKEAPRGQV